MERKEINYTELAKERIITIADLIVEIIRRLWLVIIAVIIFALLFGGYKYVKDSRAIASSAEPVQEKDLDELQENLSDEERKAVNNVICVQDNAIEQQEYIENSVLMKVNAFDESNVSLQYHFTLPDASAEYAQDLSEVYQNYVNDGGLSADLKQQGYELDVQYLQELLSCEITSKAYENDADAVLVEKTNSFVVRVIHVNEEECLALAEKIQECIESYSQLLQNRVGEHSLNIVDQSYAEVVDKNLWTYKLDRVNSLVSMQDKIDTLKADMSDAQLDVIDAYIENEELQIEKEGEAVEPESASISKKYVVLGAGVGFILACLYIIFCYIARGTINKAEDLQYMYNMRILGKLNSSGKKQPFLKVLDLLLGRKNQYLTVDEQVAFLVANLRAYCKREQVKELLVCGASGIVNAEKYLGQIAEALEKDGIKTERIENMLYSEAAIEKMDSVHHVVLVETVRASRYMDIAREIEVCLEQQAEIAGTVVLY